MFDIPNNKNITKVIVDKEVVEKEKSPIIIYQDKKKDKKVV